MMITIPIAKIITAHSKESGIQKSIIKQNNDKIHPVGKRDD